SHVLGTRRAKGARNARRASRIVTAVGAAGRASLRLAPGTRATVSAVRKRPRPARGEAWDAAGGCVLRLQWLPTVSVHPHGGDGMTIDLPHSGRGARFHVDALIEH